MTRERSIASTIDTHAPAQAARLLVADDKRQACRTCRVGMRPHGRCNYSFCDHHHARRWRRAFNELHLRHTLHRSCIFGLRRRRKAAGTVADCYASALSKLVQLYRAREESTVYILLCNPRYNCTTWQRLGASLGLLWGKTPKVLNSTCFGADYTVRDLKIPTFA